MLIRVGGWVGGVGVGVGGGWGGVGGWVGGGWVGGVGGWVGGGGGGGGRYRVNTNQYFIKKNSEHKVLI